MSIANIKISSEIIKEIQSYTGEKTGQKAVQKALLYFIRAARQRRVIQALEQIQFKKGFNPLKLRKALILEERDDKIALRPKRTRQDKLAWKETFQEMAQTNEDWLD